MLGQLRKLGKVGMRKGKPKSPGTMGKAMKFAREQLGKDTVEDMMSQGFSKEDIIRRARKSASLEAKEMGDPDDLRKARDIAEGGMRSAERPGLRMKKGGVATKKKKKKSNGLSNGIVPADKYFTKKAYKKG